VNDGRDHRRTARKATDGHAARLPAVGTIVRVERDETRYPPKGTWARYRGRVGRVVTIHREHFPSGRVYVEIGVCWALNDHRHGQADSWFLPTEVVVVGHSPVKARLGVATGQA
jgi:hypothetical protein